ncbi:protein rep [Limosilactobacillus vaginalis]|uniref:protein rep n=1 Tax=Limosilactobacillus vaginalis TaxID=1633 RepID=UPI0024BB0FEF|nr:protein rep [Limosilactobacillus vaginalis]
MYKKEILKDTSKNSGRVRPWREKKLANLTYSDYLEVLKFKKANNVSKCGEVLQFAKTGDGLKLYQTWFCHSRLCPLCSWRRSMKNSYELRKILDEAYRKEPNSVFLFLTLTEESSKLGELRKNLTSMNRSIYKLFQYKDVKKDLLGYVRSTEVTVNRDNLTFHQHVHILLMMKSSYFAKGHYLAQKDWSQLWRRARKLDYVPVVNVKKVRASKKDSSLVASAKEVSKYQVKDYDYITDDEKGDLTVIDELEHALAGTRQISFAGILKEIRHELLLDQKEDDLINVDSEKEKNDVVDTVMFKWSSKVKNYVRWE